MQLRPQQKLPAQRAAVRQEISPDSDRSGKSEEQKTARTQSWPCYDRTCSPKQTGGNDRVVRVIARLSRDECKRVEARELLQSTAGSPIHRGLDTLDLNEAKALLDTLEAFSACAVISGSLAMSAAIGRASSRVRCGPR